MTDDPGVRTFDIRYQIGDEGVFATTPDVPEWFVVGATVAEVRDLVVDGVEFVTGDGSPFRLVETFRDARQAAGTPN